MSTVDEQRLPAARPAERMTLTAKRRRRALALISVPTVLVALFCGIPLVSVVIYSFYKPWAYGMKPDFVLDSYIEFFTTATYLQTLGFTFLIAAIVLPLMVVLCYPIAYFIAFYVRSERLKLYLLLLCIVPFWTSALIRMVAWLPLLGRKGLFNQILMGLEIIDEPADILLYSEPSMVFSMAFIWSVFMIGPIYFSMAKIDRQVIEAARDLGASTWTTFWKIIFPLTKPGLATGILFVFVVMMGEFAIQKFIGGSKTAMLANVLFQQQSLLQWPAASVVAVVMVLVTIPVIVGIFHFVNLRREL
jgi:putative spermidine/putrescine transport system permease protein